jgi:hypothetical protein
MLQLTGDRSKVFAAVLVTTHISAMRGCSAGFKAGKW